MIDQEIVTGLEPKTEIVDEIVKTITPWGRFKKVIKKVLLFVITLKWFLELARLIGKMLIKWADMIRQATLMQLSKKYHEDDVWKTVLWIKVWRWIFGLVVGLILQHYFDIITKVLDLLEIVST